MSYGVYAIYFIATGLDHDNLSHYLSLTWYKKFDYSKNLRTTTKNNISKRTQKLVFDSNLIEVKAKKDRKKVSLIEKKSKTKAQYLSFFFF